MVYLLWYLLFENIFIAIITRISAYNILRNRPHLSSIQTTYYTRTAKVTQTQSQINQHRKHLLVSRHPRKSLDVWWNRPKNSRCIFPHQIYEIENCAPTQSRALAIVRQLLFLTTRPHTIIAYTIWLLWLFFNF